MNYVYAAIGVLIALGLFNIGARLRYICDAVRLGFTNQAGYLSGISDTIYRHLVNENETHVPYMKLATVAMQDRVLDLQRKQAMREHNERNAIQLIHAKAEHDRDDYIKGLTMGILQVNHYNISVEEAKAMAEGIMVQFDSAFAPGPAESLDDEPSVPNMGTEQPPTDSIQ